MHKRDLRLRAMFGRRGTAAVLASLVVVMATLPNVGAETNRFQGAQIRASSPGEAVRVPVPPGFRVSDEDSVRVLLLNVQAKGKTKYLGAWRKSEDDASSLASVSQPKELQGKRVTLSDFQKLRAEWTKREILSDVLAKGKKGKAVEEKEDASGSVRTLPVHLENTACMGFSCIEKGEEDGKAIYYVSSRGWALVRFTLFVLDVTCKVRDKGDVDKAVADTRASLKDWLDDVESANPGTNFSSGLDSVDCSFVMPNLARTGDGGASHGRPYSGRSSKGNAGKDKEKDEDKEPRVWIPALICAVSGGVAGLICALLKRKKWRT